MPRKPRRQPPALPPRSGWLFPRRLADQRYEFSPRVAGGERRTIPLWECRCMCGRRLHVLGNTLRTGASKSCGCLVIYRRAAVEMLRGGSPDLRGIDGRLLLRVIDAMRAGRDLLQIDYDPSIE